MGLLAELDRLGETIRAGARDAAIDPPFDLVRLRGRGSQAILALPQNLAKATRLGWRTVDTIWRAAGDVATDGEEEFFAESDAETVDTIKDLIETRVRPAVANDGGDITFRGFKDGIVYLNMKGSCAGCPSSTATLQHGIQNLLRHGLEILRRPPFRLNRRQRTSLVAAFTQGRIERHFAEKGDLQRFGHVPRPTAAEYLDLRAIGTSEIGHVFNHA